MVYKLIFFVGYYLVICIMVFFYAKYHNNIFKDAMVQKEGRLFSIVMSIFSLAASLALVVVPITMFKTFYAMIWPSQNPSNYFPTYLVIICGVISYLLPTVYLGYKKHREGIRKLHK